MGMLKISDEAKKKIEAIRKKEIRKQEKFIFQMLSDLGFAINEPEKLREQLEAAQTAAPELFIKDEDPASDKAEKKSGKEDKEAISSSTDNQGYM